ncbi:elongation factor G [Candidatus Vidania fulgoroideorum]
MKLRNIGICAHIDAGKTTLTERILFYTGKKHKIGEVHDGEATMDFLDQEQERGITINSAATHVFWDGIDKKKGKHKINIIDTPGHVDFTAEVERSMRVLDGACVVFCSVAGVQAQSETVWGQINKYKIPRIVFINKMDRNGSNYNKVCKQIEKKFLIKVLKIHYPIYKNGNFFGIIDVLKEKKYIFDEKSKGKKILTKNLDENIILKIKKKKKKIIEYIVNDSDYFLNKYLNNSLNLKDIIKIIRKKTLEMKVTPAFCGSAFKNKGVQNVLDGILDFLPSPLDKKYYYLKKKKKKILKIKSFSAFVFKISNDSYGKLIYIRIYSGSLKVGDSINSSSGKNYKINRIIQINANIKTDVKEVFFGDIAVLIGLKNIKTGDTLYKKKYITFEEIKFPEPVISYSIKPLNYNYEKFIKILKNKSLEDPTISININKEIVISGMGELHVEVFIEKIKREFGIIVKKSEPMVSYKETISKVSKNIEGKYIRQSGGRGQYGHVVINIYPRKIGKGFKFVNLIKGGVIPKEFIKPIKKSIEGNLIKGAFGNPITDIKVELVFGSFHEVDSNENAFKIAASIAFKNAIENSNPVILEPIMKVEINTPTENLGDIIGNISSKKGIIKICKKMDNFSIIKCFIPMSEMFSYSTILRSLTKGRASFVMEFSHYKLKS